ncbi:ribbon-helix-helix protein, CopG family [Rhodococcus erythropolis]
MSSLTVRISRTTRSELEEIAKARGQSVSEMVRALIEHAIECSKSGEIAADSVSAAGGRRE